MQVLHNCKIVVYSVKESLTIATLANEKPVSTNLRNNMTKSEIRELQIITKYSAAGLGPDYVARAISSLIRAARSQKSAEALRAHALAFGVTNHPEFIA
jgi:hypothetical protein